MKQFNLTFTYNPDASFTAQIIDKIEADDLVELLAQFLLVIANVQRTLAGKAGQLSDDDIPF